LAKFIFIISIIFYSNSFAVLPEFEISGIVLDETTSKPIENVMIFIAETELKFKTSTDGKLKLSIQEKIQYSFYLSEWRSLVSKLL